MSTSFQQKVKHYKVIKDVDEQKAEQILIELRKDIQKMVEGDDSYTIDNRIIVISTATIDELCIVYADLDKKELGNTLSAISDSERDRQTSKNLYGPKNPYY